MRHGTIILFLTLMAQFVFASAAPIRLKCGFQAKPGKSPLSANIVIAPESVRTKFVVDTKSPVAPNQRELDLDQIVVSMSAQNGGQVSKYGYVSFKGFGQTSDLFKTFREVELSVLKTELAKTENIQISFGISGELYAKDSRGTPIYNYGMICQKVQ